MAYKIEGCIGCGSCEMNCPVGAISAGDDGLYQIDKEKCIGCGTCAAVCPVGAPREDEE